MIIGPMGKGPGTRPFLKLDIPHRDAPHLTPANKGPWEGQQCRVGLYDDSYLPAQYEDVPI